MLKLCTRFICQTRVLGFRTYFGSCVNLQKKIMLKLCTRFICQTRVLDLEHILVPVLMFAEEDDVEVMY